MTQRSSVLIAPMRASDAAEVAFAAKSLLGAEAWSEGAYQERETAPFAHALVARMDGTLAGFLDATDVCGECTINALAVLPAFQRRGIARALMGALVEAIRPQAECLTLEVRVSNQAARALYARLGFYEAGRRKRFYTRPTEDALILTRPL